VNDQTLSLTKQDEDMLVVRALHTQQKAGIDTFAFFVPGSQIVEIADISRITRTEQDDLKGFQRKEIRNHVNSIVEFLDQGDVLFPNAVILALGPEAEFKQARGPKPAGLTDVASMGTLHIPKLEEGQRAAWIVDGQQRSLALSKTKNGDLPVPVVAFVCPDIEVQREQFILVNKAKPLPRRLISELLPEVGTLLPRDLSVRKLPSELCNLLNKDPKSPLHNLIRRMSDDSGEAVITDSAIEQAIQKSLRPPFGTLNQYKGLGHSPSDTDAMYQVLLMYWAAVKETFPDAWGLPPTKSRLMHSAGIRAMGVLMDHIMLRADSSPDPAAEVRASLKRIEPYCCWTEGTWEGLGWRWDEIQSTHSHINKLTDYLSRKDRELARKLA
jgi:DGQHR domain-containing protein